LGIEVAMECGVFWTLQNRSMFHLFSVSWDLREANEKKGLKWTCLDFRHTFGSMLAMKGESLYKISTLMGNSPEICRRHYAALVPEAMTDSVEFGASPCRKIFSA
jgi:integrase